MRARAGGAVCRVTLALTAGAVLGAAALPARAQEGTAVDQFDPTPVGDDAFGVQSPHVRGRLRLRAGAGLDLAHDSLVLRSTASDAEIGAVVGDQLWLRLSGSLAVDDRFLFSLMVPAAIVQGGDDPSDPTSGLAARSPDGVELGDVRLGARVKVLEASEAFVLSLGGHLWLPTGNGDSYVSDESLRGRPFVVAGGNIDRLSWSGELGVLARAGSELPGDARTPVGTAITFGAALGLLVDEARTLRIGPELYGQSVVARGGTFLSEKSTNSELLAGGRWRPGGGDWRLGLAAGPGLGHGAGTPAYRLIAAVDWVPDDVVEPPGDRDGDGILDPDDTCPDLAGVATGDPRTHGCPSDRDADNVLDADDACPNVAGIASDDPKRHGCPPDHDGDGIVDAQDACPDVAGIASDDPKRHGCPPDRDGDGIVDPKDACPDVAGVAQPEAEKNGCPLAKLEETQITILQKIEFDVDRATIRPESDPILVDVAKIMREHPEVTRVDVQGHTDSTGSRAHNTQLSQERAGAVVKRLGELGIAGGRLAARGFGPDRPLGDNATDAGRAANRRVEFHVVRGPAAAQDRK